VYELVSRCGDGDVVDVGRGDSGGGMVPLVLVPVKSASTDYVDNTRNAP